MTEGKKWDDGKDRWDLVPQASLDDLVKVITYGAKKYGDENWKNVESSRYYAAAMRHIAAWRRGEWRDKESGLPHLAHAMCSLMFVMELEAWCAPKAPTRPKPEPKAKVPFGAISFGEGAGHD